MNNNLNIKVVDLFCGIGGLTHGLVKEGLDVVAGYDLDEDCRYPYEANNSSKFYCSDVSEVSSEEILKHFTGADIKVLVGCAPCQPFSTYAFKSNDKKKWRLLYQFLRLIEGSSPDIVSMENVPRLASFMKEPIFEDFIERLEQMKYDVSYEIVNCAEFGVPQARKRLVLMASKLGTINLPKNRLKPEEFKTVRNAIAKLPSLENGEINVKDSMHRAAKLSGINLKRIQQSLPGGTWKDWDENLILECHKKSSGNSYVSVYGRMSWDKPSPTITTHCTGIGNGRFGHPEQDRGISLREAAILQSFPKKYKFVKNGSPYKVKTMSTHIGNAVPVKLGKAIGKAINRHIAANS